MVLNEGLFSRKGLSLDRLRSFLVVVDAGGFARAAPRQPVRQSQLSRQVAELEAFFGCELLARSGRSVAPTEAGTRLAGLVRELEQGLHEVARPSGAALRFRLGAGDSVLHWWVLPRLTPLTLAVPPSEASVMALAPEEVVPRLQAAELDFALLRGRPAGLRARPLGRLGFALYVPRSLSPKGGELARALATVPLALQGSDPTPNERLENVARSLGVKLRVAVRCETFPQAAALVRAGSASALLPTLAAPELPRGVVAFPIPGFAQLEATLHLAWHPRLERSSLEPLAALLERALRLPSPGDPG